MKFFYSTLHFNKRLLLLLTTIDAHEAENLSPELESQSKTHKSLLTPPSGGYREKKKERKPLSVNFATSTTHPWNKKKKSQKKTFDQLDEKFSQETSEEKVRGAK